MEIIMNKLLFGQWLQRIKLDGDDQNGTYFGIANPCAFLERGPNAEVLVASPHDYDERRLKKVGTAPLNVEVE